MRHLLLYMIAALFSQFAMAEEPNPVELLKKSDQARGGGLPGLVWEVTTKNSGSQIDEDEPPMRLLIKASNRASLVETLEPLRSKGSRMLQVERNMWLNKPGLTKPIPISPRQRLTGQAAIGDIAATNYVSDYEPKFLRDEEINGEPCHVLALTATNRQTTYDNITYWVSSKRNVAIQADFLSLSGKKMKSAVFEYGNKIEVNGQALPFVSHMVISDALTDAKTSLDYGQITVRTVPESEFDINHFQ